MKSVHAVKRSASLISLEPDVIKVGKPTVIEALVIGEEEGHTLDVVPLALTLLTETRQNVGHGEKAVGLSIS